MITESNHSFKKFMTVWAGEFVSCVGSGLTAFALAVYAYQLTHSAESVALVTLCAFLPSILLSPIGGVLADRFDRRLMMMLGDFFSAFGLIIMLVILSVGNLEIWQICICVTISSVFTALMEPAYKATVTDLLTEEEYAKASGLVQVAGSAKYLISPILAGLILGFTDLRVILLIDISTFIVTVLTTLSVKRNIQTTVNSIENRNFIAELREGWIAVTKDSGIFFLVLLMSLITFSIGFMQTLYGPLLLPFTDAKTVGTLESVSAVGMLIGSILIGVFSISKKYVNVLSIGIAIAGISFSLLGVSTHIYFVAGAGILFFGALPFVNTSADVLIRKNIANEVQGRAWGMIGILSQFGSVAAYACSGLLADKIFNPMMKTGGLLSDTVGKVIGTGEGRGIGLLFIILGLLIAGTAVVIHRTESIHELELG